jgi:hypothetical protein
VVLLESPDRKVPYIPPPDGVDSQPILAGAVNLQQKPRHEAGARLAVSLVQITHLESKASARGELVWGRRLQSPLAPGGAPPGPLGGCWPPARARSTVGPQQRRRGPAVPSQDITPELRANTALHHGGPGSTAESRECFPPLAKVESDKLSSFSSALRPSPKMPSHCACAAAFSFRYRSGGGGLLGSLCCISQHRETGSAAQVAEGHQPSARARCMGPRGKLSEIIRNGPKWLKCLKIEN